MKIEPIQDSFIPGDDYENTPVPSNCTIDMSKSDVVDISAVPPRTDFIHKWVCKYDIVHEEDLDSNSIVAVDVDTIDIPHSSLEFLCNVICIYSDSEMTLVTLYTNLYPSLHPTQVFDDQETSFLYSSSILFITGHFQLQIQLRL